MKNRIFPKKDNDWSERQVTREDKKNKIVLTTQHYNYGGSGSGVKEIEFILSDWEKIHSSLHSGVFNLLHGIGKVFDKVESSNLKITNNLYNDLNRKYDAAKSNSESLSREINVLKNKAIKILPKDKKDVVGVMVKLQTALDDMGLELWDMEQEFDEKNKENGILAELRNKINKNMQKIAKGSVPFEPNLNRNEFNKKLSIATDLWNRKLWETNYKSARKIWYELRGWLIDTAPSSSLSQKTIDKWEEICTPLDNMLEKIRLAMGGESNSTELPWGEGDWKGLKNSLKDKKFISDLKRLKENFSDSDDEEEDKYGLHPKWKKIAVSNIKKIAFAESNRDINAIRAIAKSIIGVLQQIAHKLAELIRSGRRDKKFEAYAREKAVEAAKWYNQHKRYETKVREVLRVMSYVQAIMSYLKSLEQDVDNEGVDKRDRTIVLSPAHYNITPGKFRPSVFRRFGVGLGVGAMLGGYAGYKLGQRKGKKKFKKSLDTIVLTDIMNKSGFFCPYCSATLVLKNPMDDAVRCKCGKNFTVIMKHVFHPKDKHMGMSFDPFDEFEKIGLLPTGLPIENIKLIGRVRSKLKRLWDWRHKKTEAKAEEPVAKADRTVEQVKRAIRRAEERTMRAGKRTLPAFGRPPHPTAESDYQKELDILNRLKAELERIGGMQKGFPIAPLASIADDVALYGYYGYKNRKNKRKQMRQTQSQINRR